MRRLLRILIPLFLLLDIGYSFKQHFHTELDGDMPGIVLPAGWYSEVLKDPFAIRVLLYGKEYAAPNRFFSHWAMSAYFKKIPLLFQKIAEPIDSVYLATAFAKTGVQLLIVWLLSSMISGKKNVFKIDFLLAAILMTPLFQTNGYYVSIGLIEMTPTFFFFYTLPIAGLLLFFYPFYDFIFFGKEIKIGAIKSISLLALCFILPFSGPLVAALVLVICPLVLLKTVHSNYKNILTGSILEKSRKAVVTMPGQLLFMFIAICLISVYSLYIGSFNVENSSSDIPLLERYSRVPKGLFNMYIIKPAFPLLFISIAVNIWLIKKYSNEFYKKIIICLKWASLFILIYILLLPLGGYRRYRPFIVRNDTMIPVTLVLFYLYTISTYYLFKKMPVKPRYYFTAFVVVILSIFTFSDKPKFDKNKCQRDAILEIVQSNDEMITLENTCDVLNWGKIKYPESSQYSSRLLKAWRIIDREKVFVQK